MPPAPPQPPNVPVGVNCRIRSLSSGMSQEHRATEVFVEVIIDKLFLQHVFVAANRIGLIAALDIKANRHRVCHYDVVDEPDSGVARRL